MSRGWRVAALWVLACLCLPAQVPAQAWTVDMRAGIPADLLAAMAPADKALAQDDAPKATQIAESIWYKVSAEQPADPMRIGLVERWRGGLYLAAGRYFEANSWTLKAIGRWGEPRYAAPRADAVLQLAKVYLEADWRDGAFAYFHEAIGRYRRLGTPGEVGWVEAQAQLAGLCLIDGRLDEAQLRYDSVLAIQAREPVKDVGAMAFTFNNIAAVYAAKGRSDHARGAYDHALHLLETHYGAGSLEATTTLTNLGALLHAALEDAPAESLLLKAYAIREQKLPLYDPLVLASLDNLLNFYADRREQAKAEQLLLAAKIARERKFGGDSAPVAEILDRFANLHIALGNLPTAEQYWVLALQVRENALGSSDEMVAANLYNLGKLENLLGKVDQARIHLNGARFIYENRKLGNESQIAAILSELFVCDYLQGKLHEAEENLQLVYVIKQQVYGHDHAETVAVMEELVKFYQHAGWEIKAEAMQQEITRIRSGR